MWAGRTRPCAAVRPHTIDRNRLAPARARRSATASWYNARHVITRTAEPETSRLRRALGRWDLTAIGINQVIGGAIFLIPAQIAAEIGTWSVVGFLAIGFASLIVALCFAEVGSRFDTTGGPLLYARAAFGRFTGFEVGWMQWFTRASSHASVMSGIALALGYYWPGLAAGTGRTILFVALTSALAAINVRGIRQSALVVNTLTVGKLVPLAVFVGAGVFAIHPPTLLQGPPEVTVANAAAAALLMIFMFGGYDVIAVPGGEAVNPRRDVPFALVATILAVTLVMTLTQVVTQGTLADVASRRTPVADAAQLFLGPLGALMIGVGSVISMLGNNAGQVLTGSRMLFALAEGGDLPAFFGRIHPRYRTPSNAIVFTSAVALVLALTGSFVKLAIVSAVARLVIYTSTCAATLVLRQERFAERVRPATFVAPLGPLIPVLGVVLSLAVLAGASREQLVGGAAALAAGAILYALAGRR